MKSHEATEPYIGYVFQGQFSLILLLDAGDEEGVGIETADDVELLSPSQPTLFQLKHSRGNPPTLTEKNSGFWKTLGIWIENTTLYPKNNLVFVTCAELKADSPLQSLCQSRSDRNAVQFALENEAKDVIQQVETARLASQRIPHAERHPACYAFMNLDSKARLDLLERITVKPESFNANQIMEEIAKRLDRVVKISLRQSFYQRLLEWWDLQVVSALLGKRNRVLQKHELHEKFHSLMTELGTESLTNDYSQTKPTNDELEGELGGCMERQILVVNGGRSRVQRAAIARWQARNQRERWMRDNLAAAASLEQYDKRLIDEWRGQYEPLCDDVRSTSDEEKSKAGLQLLDWTHNTAPLVVQPPKSTWSDPFLTRGSYQQLSEEMRVGWYPEFESHPELKQESVL